MLSCREVVARTSAFADGELGWRERMQLRVHVAMCHRCRGFMRTFGGLRGALLKLPDEPVDATHPDALAIDRIVAGVGAGIRGAATGSRSAGSDPGFTQDPDAPETGR